MTMQLVCSEAQKLTPSPVFPSDNKEVTVRFYVDSCDNKALLNYTGDVYVHTGVYVNGGSQWDYVVADWSENIAKAKCNRVGTNVYEVKITPTIKDYYGIDQGDTVTSLNFVLRSSDGTKQTEDLFQPVYETGLTVEITNPVKPVIVPVNTPITVRAQSINIGTPSPDQLQLYVDDMLVYTSSSDTLEHVVMATSPGKHWIRTDGMSGSYSSSDSVFYFVKKELPQQDIPDSLSDGINYLGDTSVVLVLYAPYKESVFLIGDFNQWELNNDFQLVNTPDGDRWWIALDDLDPDPEYAFQYLVDGNLRIADPYAEKILDPWNDSYIPASTYPDLKPYPEDETSEIVSILQINQEEYSWKDIDFIKPPVEDMVIYELHVQNFTDAGNIKTLTDTLDYLSRLGVNAIEVMPVNEFEGNYSWGYNPSFYFAIDKMYGSKNDFKAFVDKCHIKGMAVLVDMVLNHSYGQSPLVRLYWNNAKGKPATNNPWFNTDPKHDFNVGYDMDHESLQTRAFCSRVMKYWLEEFKIDGFRFDLAKGFTQNNTLGNPSAMAQYDSSRVAIWKYYADTIWSLSDKAMVILEHFADNTEEKELAGYGMLLWENLNSNYNEATMGYNENSKSDLGWAFYTQRGWDVPHNVDYMESHDEERLMYKNKEYGQSNLLYNIKEIPTGLQRIETAAAFFFTVPGPKMIWEWEELGYDYSINTCADGSVNNCRLDLKPIKWDYYDSYERYRLYKVFEAFIDFKQLSICRTSDFDFDVSGALKAIHLNGTDTNATILGNFDTHTWEIAPKFQHTGPWYNYITGDTLVVNDVSAPVKLKPGEYMVLTDVHLDVIDLPEGYDIPDVTNTHIQVDKKFNIYPNPLVGDKMVIEFKRDFLVGPIDVCLFNINGKVLMHKKYKRIDGNMLVVDIGDIGSQILNCKIICNGHVSDRLVIKE
jgi:hypothetical protein